MLIIAAIIIILHRLYHVIYKHTLNTEELMLLNCGVGEDSWESLDCKEIQPVNPKGNQSWVFIRRTDAEAETAILWPPDANRWLTGKDPDAGKDRRQEEKGTTENEMVGCHHWLNGHEFEQAPGVANEQGMQSTGLQRVRCDWAAELNWSPLHTNLLVANFQRCKCETSWWHSG